MTLADAMRVLEFKANKHLLEAMYAGHLACPRRAGLWKVEWLKSQIEAAMTPGQHFRQHKGH